jgi:Uma2 family endonuclease
MTHLVRIPTTMTADEFVETDQCVFGDAWRYELVDGVIVAHAAASDRHAVILANVVFEVKGRLKDHGEGCYVETGSAVIPRRKTRNTARVPDALVRCKGFPRVTFEIVSPSELRHVRDRDKRREDVKQVEGVAQIIEIYQHTMAAHVHIRMEAGGWDFIPVSGSDASLDLPSLGISIPLIALYENAMPADERKK